jgi:membrane protein
MTTAAWWRRAWRFGRRVQQNMADDNLTLVAAGVAFYAMLALFPAMISMVTVYALVADAEQVRTQLEPVLTGLPPDARTLILRQLTSAVEKSDGGLTLGLVVSLVATVWAASGGMAALMTGLNIITEQKETRSFVKLRVTALVLTLAALVAAVVALGLIAAFPVALDWLGLDPVAAVAAHAARWLMLVVLVAVGLAVARRYGPAPHGACWRWVTPGTLTSVVVWVLASAGFSLYVSFFGSYDKTYGTLAAVIVLLLWLYLSAFAVLLGAEIDADREAAAAVRAAALNRAEAEPTDAKQEQAVLAGEAGVRGSTTERKELTDA